MKVIIFMPGYLAFGYTKCKCLYRRDTCNVINYVTIIPNDIEKQLP